MDIDRSEHTLTHKEVLNKLRQPKNVIYIHKVLHRTCEHGSWRINTHTQSHIWRKCLCLLRTVPLIKGNVQICLYESSNDYANHKKFFFNPFTSLYFCHLTTNTFHYTGIELKLLTVIYQYCYIVRIKYIPVLQLCPFPFIKIYSEQWKSLQ